ncbi:MAG: hypothetical protein K2P46_00200, partial [Alistipes sp.]|nr:hypothetical protein [Alistipes sp.]
EPYSSTVFKTAAIDHSAIFPGAKVTCIFDSAKCSCRKRGRPGPAVPKQRAGDEADFQQKIPESAKIP